MSQKLKQEEGLEGTLLAVLALMLVISATAAVYFLIARSAPNEIGTPEWDKAQLVRWIWTVFGTFFFLYGIVGVIREKIAVGWGGICYRVTTFLEGASAFTAGTGTALGGLLMLATAAVYFYPALGGIIHSLATLICGFASIFLSWICGLIIRALGY
jgi:hypothetical protein